MKILFEIIHPKSVHIYKHLIKGMIRKGHDIKVISINKDITLRLLKYYDIQYELILNSTGKGRIQKLLLFVIGMIRIHFIFLKFKPDITIGRASPMMAINSWIFRKRHYSLSDTEHVRNIHKLSKKFSYKIITPDCFSLNLGNKQVRIPSYLELAYLHPKRFTPNPEVLEKIGLNENDKYFVLRFVSWGASHDIGEKGLSDKGKRRLIEYLKDKGKIIISSESPLPLEFEDYKMSICPTKMHDLLYYADMYIGESPTMATESVILGTKSFLINSWAYNAGNMEDICKKYKIMSVYRYEQEFFEKFETDLEKMNHDYKLKHKKFLEDKIDVTDYIIKLIENE
jgi:predicted glycosyltransferase